MIYNLVDIIDTKDSTFDSEDSYYFLRDYILYKPWHVYSTEHYSVEIVSHLCKLFTAGHGQVFLVHLDSNTPTIWSSAPLGIFRYRMDSNNFWQEIGYLNKIKGYIVEGAYWNNGFFYQVKDEKKLIEMKLFIDDQTSIRYNYPYTPHRSI
jgi:hypothetical protein